VQVLVRDQRSLDLLDVLNRQHVVLGVHADAEISLGISGPAPGGTRCDLLLER